MLLGLRGLRANATRSLSSTSSSAAARAEAIAQACAEKGIKFVQFSFTDLLGVQRAKLVPVSRVQEVAEGGAGFAGFAAYLGVTPADGDTLAMPDPSSMTVLPWKREVAWLACDLVGAKGPRDCLHQSLAKLEDKAGLTLKTGVECEFFLLDPDSPRVADRFDTTAKPCYDQHALMRRFDLISELMESMEWLGWGPYQADHEDANGQFEINWDFNDALTTADRVVFFKYMVRTLAEAKGLRATFMPKPFAHTSGSGCHMHLSLHDAGTGANVCGGGSSAEHHGLSDQALAFAQGLLSHAADGSLAAISNPTVNSFKRLGAVSSRNASGATWAPNRVSWGGNNRSVMLRVPDDKRMELRVADMAANAYLLPAAVAGAGLDGILAGAPPSLPPVEVDLYGADAAASGLVASLPTLPGHLGEALVALKGSASLKESLGAETVDAYVEMREAHWRRYLSHLSTWEVEEEFDV